MPHLTHGVIEILKEDLSWRGVVVIDDLVGISPEITSILFDVDNLKAKKPRAARRGMPQDRSELVDKMWPVQDCFSETWISPEEIWTTFRVKRLMSGWALVFGIINTFAEIYGTNKVRLVVWFTE